MLGNVDPDELASVDRGRGEGNGALRAAAADWPVTP